LFLFPLFLGVFVSSPVSSFSLRVYNFCWVFPFLFHTHFFICLFISLRVFPCVFNFFMCLFSAHYLCFLSVFLSPCEALCRPAGHVKISCCKDCSCNIVGRLTTYLVIRYSLFPPSHVCLNPCQSFSPQLRDAFAQYACPLLYAVLDG
jgi:hypothetical protein